nr:clp protease proteolytic subunit [Euphorbia bisellenbeckii]
MPKVPFQHPEDEDDDAFWTDNRLYRQRLLFLCQGINNEISNQLSGLMIYLSIEDGTKDVYLFINSTGGWVVPGIGLYDTMQFVQSDVQTICMGLASSMGSFILVGGAVTKRLAFPHARIMMHQPIAGFIQEKIGEFVMDSEELMKMRDFITKIYARRTGKPLWIVSADIERDVFMSAAEAQAHGIVDLISAEY